jgi:hypothetical protein
MRLLWPAMWLAGAASAGFAQTTYHVDGSCGDDAWSGLSPVCGAPDGPKRRIPAGLALAGPGDTVIVAPGTYPMETNSFSLNEPVTLRSSGGPLVTIIDGAYEGPRFTVRGQDGGPRVIQGFTVTRIHTNSLGLIGVYDADLRLIDCRFVDNAAFYCGVTWDDMMDSTVAAVNCVFQHNSGRIAVMFAEDLLVVGCTFVNNVSPGGGYTGVAADESLTGSNCIFRGPGPFTNHIASVEFTNIEGGYPGEGNIDADPLFVDEAAGDLRLSPGSPCIDAGSNSAVPEGVVTDLAGRPRFVDDPGTVDTGEGSPPVVDMGAHEFQAPCYADFTGDGVLDLFDFLAYVNAFNAADPAADCTGDGVLDLFDFLCFVNAFNNGC